MTNPGAPQFAGWIMAQENAYYLLSPGADTPEPPTGGNILSNEADGGSVYVSSHTHTGLIRLTVVAERSEPARPSGWDSSDTSEIFAEDGELYLIKLNGGEPDGSVNLANRGPGGYRVRIHRRAHPLRPGDISPDEGIDPDDDIERGLSEEHLIEIWPTSAD
jgi:hypothetical protein